MSRLAYFSTMSGLLSFILLAALIWMIANRQPAPLTAEEQAEIAAEEAYERDIQHAKIICWSLSDNVESVDDVEDGCTARGNAVVAEIRPGYPDCPRCHNGGCSGAHPVSAEFESSCRAQVLADVLAREEGTGGGE